MTKDKRPFIIVRLSGEWNLLLLKYCDYVIFILYFLLFHKEVFDNG